VHDPVPDRVGLPEPAGDRCLQLIRIDFGPWRGELLIGERLVAGSDDR
jgi:hypothetical protein